MICSEAEPVLRQVVFDIENDSIGDRGYLRRSWVAIMIDRTNTRDLRIIAIPRKAEVRRRTARPFSDIQQDEVESGGFRLQSVGIERDLGEVNAKRRRHIKVECLNDPIFDLNLALVSRDIKIIAYVGRKSDTDVGRVFRFERLATKGSQQRVSRTQRSFQILLVCGRIKGQDNCFQI